MNSQFRAPSQEYELPIIQLIGESQCQTVSALRKSFTIINGDSEEKESVAIIFDFNDKGCAIRNEHIEHSRKYSRPLVLLNKKCECSISELIGFDIEGDYILYVKKQYAIIEPLEIHENTIHKHLFVMIKKDPVNDSLTISRPEEVEETESNRAKTADNEETKAKKIRMALEEGRKNDLEKK
jgi:hypothetical protein